MGHLNSSINVSGRSKGHFKGLLTRRRIEYRSGTPSAVE
jgi:hypothetical protein